MDPLVCKHEQHKRPTVCISCVGCNNGSNRSFYRLFCENPAVMRLLASQWQTTQLDVLVPMPPKVQEDEWGDSVAGATAGADQTPWGPAQEEGSSRPRGMKDGEKAVVQLQDPSPQTPVTSRRWGPLGLHWSPGSPGPAPGVAAAPQPGLVPGSCSHDLLPSQWLLGATISDPNPLTLSIPSPYPCGTSAHSKFRGLFFFCYCVVEVSNIFWIVTPCQI